MIALTNYLESLNVVFCLQTLLWVLTALDEIGSTQFWIPNPTLDFKNITSLQFFASPPQVVVSSTTVQLLLNLSSSVISWSEIKLKWVSFVNTYLVYYGPLQPASLIEFSILSSPPSRILLGPVTGLLFKLNFLFGLYILDYIIFCFCNCAVYLYFFLLIYENKIK